MKLEGIESGSAKAVNGVAPLRIAYGAPRATHYALFV